MSDKWVNSYTLHNQKLAKQYATNRNYYNQAKIVQMAVPAGANEMAKLMKKALGYQTVGRYIYDAIVRDLYSRGYVSQNLNKKEFDRIMYLAEGLEPVLDKIDKEAKETHRKAVAKNRKKSAKYKKERDEAVLKATNRVREKYGKAPLQAKTVSTESVGPDTGTDQQEQ